MSQEEKDLRQAAFEELAVAKEAMAQGLYLEGRHRADSSLGLFLEADQLSESDVNSDLEKLIEECEALYNKADLYLLGFYSHIEKVDNTLKEYGRIRKFITGGLAGDPLKAVEAANWLISPPNICLMLPYRDKFVKDALKLIDTVRCMEKAGARLQALAYNIGAKIYSVPLYESLNIKKAISYAKEAVKIEQGFYPEISEVEQNDILTTAMEVVLCKDDVQYAQYIDGIRKEQCLLSDCLLPFYLYACEKGLTISKDIEKQIEENGCWESLFLNGRALIPQLENEPQDESLKERTRGYVQSVLFICEEKTFRLMEEYALVGLCSYLQALDTGALEYLNSEKADAMEKAANGFSDWANYYAGKIYDMATIELTAENPEHKLIPPLHECAWTFYASAAALGNKEAIKECVRYIRQGFGDENLLEYYLKLGGTLNVFS